MQINSNFPNNREQYLHWICLFTQPHREKLAQASLVEAGFEVFAPLCVKLVLRRNKHVQTLQQLFPRYIFARGTNMAKSRRLNGVTGFAGLSLERSMVDEVIVDAIKARLDEHGVVTIKNDEIQSGQVVKIIQGPFAGLQAIFSEPDDRSRSFLLLDLMGKSHQILVLNNAFQVAF